MKTKLKSKMKCKIIKVLLYLTITLLILSVKLTLTKKHHHNKVARVGLLKKRQESLCPPEYQSSCWCDYINSNNVNGNDYQSGGSSNNKYDSTVTTLGLSYPSSAIMIDCQFYKSNNETSQTNNNNNNNKINNLLVEIPKISTTGSSKYKHLSHISYIDLSRTGIKEVPSDAFHVIIL